MSVGRTQPRQRHACMEVIGMYPCCCTACLHASERHACIPVNDMPAGSDPPLRADTASRPMNKEKQVDTHDRNPAPRRQQPVPDIPAQEI